MPTRNTTTIDPELASAAVYANSFRTVETSIASTGLRTHPFRYDALRHTPDPRVAEEFLIHSRLQRRDIDLETSIGNYHSDTAAVLVGLAGQEGRRGSHTVTLPKSVPARMTLDEAIRRRRTIRTYTGDELALPYLSTIARLAAGITGHAPGLGGAPEIPLHSIPSGGGLFPIDLHIAALHVADLSRGIYVYDPPQDVLWHTGDETQVAALLAALANPDEVISVDQAVAVCLLVGRPWRSMRKYGSRGMRYVFHEAGAMAEHINLVATALGLGSVDCGSFYDDEAHEALQIDGLYESLIHAVFLGIPG